MKKIKILRFLILTILSCLLGLCTVACNQVIEFDYNIDFVVDGKVITTVGTNGDKISMPKNPAKDNYTFDGWYWDDGEWGDKFTLNSILDQPLQEKIIIKYMQNGNRPYIIQLYLITEMRR